MGANRVELLIGEEAHVLEQHNYHSGECDTPPVEGRGKYMSKTKLAVWKEGQRLRACVCPWVSGTAASFLLDYMAESGIDTRRASQEIFHLIALPLRVCIFAS